MTTSDALARVEALPPAHRARVLEHLRKIKDKRTAEDRYEVWQRDPLVWVQEVVHAHLWSKQREIFAAVGQHTRIAVPSCHGAGKTYLAAVLAAWWLSAHEPGTAFVVSTAPTFAQVRAVLWREVNRLHKKAGLPGHVNQTEWHLDGELVGFGRKPADTDEHAFQGIHADRVLVLIDEAGGIPEQLWTAAESVAVGDNDRIVAFGNPDDPTGHFERICRDDSLWTVLPISAFDTPNLTDEAMPGGVPAGMVTRGWVERRRIEWGEDSPLWSSKVLGHFPAVDQFSVVRPGDLAAARLGLELAPHRLLPVELGIDVGGGGDDTAVRARHGARLGATWRDRTPEPEDVVKLVMRAVLETPGLTALKVDVGGIGWGVMGLLRAALLVARLPHVRIVAVNFGARAREPERYKNARAEMWWGVGRELLPALDLSTLDDRTAGELVAPRWSEDGTGRILIEPKEDVIARTGHSPDGADALLLAFYQPGPPVAASTAAPAAGPIPTGAATASRTR